MHRLLALALMLIALPACGEIGTSSHRLVGVTFEDAAFEDGFEMAFITAEAVEVRIFERTKVAQCAWIDRSAEAEARGDNTTFTMIGRTPYEAGNPMSTGDGAAYRIEVSCPRPLGMGELRFELAIAEDLSAATRLQQVDDISVELFGSSIGGYDVGRTLTLVGPQRG